MKSFLLKNWIVIIFAFVVGLIHVGPNLVFTNLPEYQGIPMIYTDSEPYYLARINAASHGCIMSCNPYISEYSDDLPFFDPSLSTLILSIPLKIFNITVLQLKIFYEFLLPAILFILIFLLIRRLTNNNLLSLSGSLLIILGHNLFNNTALLSLLDLSSLFTWEDNQLHTPLLYSRPVNPSFSSIFYISYLHLLLSYFRGNSRKILMTLLILYSLSFYIYFYTFTFLTAVNIICIIYFLITKKYSSFREFALITLLGICIGYPILFEIISLTSHPYYQHILESNWVNHTYHPLISLYGIFMSISIAFFLYIHIKKKGLALELPLIIMLIITSFMVKNQHVVSGTIVQYFHYDFYYITPVLIISLCYFVSTYISRNNGYFKSFLIVICVIVLSNGIYIQHQIYKDEFNHTLSIQKYSSVLLYIKNNIPAKSVVYAPGVLSDLVSMFHFIHQPWSSYAPYYLHDRNRPNDVSNFFSSNKLIGEGIKKYSVKYVILDKRDEASHDFTKYISSTIIYSDTVFEIHQVE